MTYQCHQAHIKACSATGTLTDDFGRSFGVLVGKKKLLRLKLFFQKKNTLIEDLLGAFSRIFSGLRSQWITRNFRKKRSDSSNWTATLRMSPSESPCHAAGAEV